MLSIAKKYYLKFLFKQLSYLTKNYIFFAITLGNLPYNTNDRHEISNLIMSCNREYR